MSRRGSWNSDKPRKNKPKACCSSDSVEAWDCGCSFGCEHCNYSYQCTVCGTLLTEEQVKALRNKKGTPVREWEE